VDEFKKELGKEVMMMTYDVNRLQRERQLLEQQIAELFTFFAKQRADLVNTVTAYIKEVLRSSNTGKQPSAAGGEHSTTNYWSKTTAYTEISISACLVIQNNYDSP
jgi:hypothetical protein